MTATRSARSAVDRRWAITTLVRPFISRSSARDIRTSVAGSTADVASSRMSTSGSRRYALAMLTNCRSPALSSSPRAPTSVSSPWTVVSSHEESPSSLNADSAAVRSPTGSVSGRA